MDKTGFKKSIHGINYQLKLLAFFLKRGLDNGYTFRLGSETDTGCFDDIFFEFNTENGKIIRLVQAKHKQNNNKKITKEELIKDGNCNFGLPKYFSSYREIMRNTLYTNDDTKIKDFIIFTNMDIDQNIQANFDSIESDDILHYDDRECKLLKIKDGELKKQIVQKFTNNSCKMLKYLATAKNLNFEHESLKQYRSVLAREVFEVSKENGLYYVKFSESFINSNKMIEFKTVFFQYWMPGTIFDINKMNSWKKLALKFKNNEKPVISNVLDFVKEITREIVKAKEADRIVYLTKRNKIIKDNIDKLSEHLLIPKSDEEKDLYYFNENFFDGICELKGNLNDFRSELKKELRNINVPFTRDEYKFCIMNFPHQKSSLPTEYITDEEIDGFLNKLILAVNQPNEVELGNVIANEISSNSVTNEFIMSKFQIYMLDWLKEETAKLLTEKDAKQFFQDTSTNLRMSNRTEEYIADIKKLLVTFNSDATIELDKNFKTFVNNSKRILNIITEFTDLSSIKFHQILQAKTNYNYIFLSLNSFLEFEEAFKTRNNNLLIIVLEKVIPDLLKLIRNLKSILNENSALKVIIIGSSEKALLNDKELDIEKYEDINFNLTDLALESQEKILSTGIVSFQGHHINLYKLLNCTLDNAVDGNILSNLIHKRELKIGAELWNLGEIENYYIMRTLKHCVNIDPVFKTKTEQFFIINGKSRKQEIFLNTTNFEHAGLNCVEPNDQQDIILISNSSDGYFEDLCNKYKHKNVHWLKKNEEKLTWKQSYGGNLSKLRNFIDKNTPEFTKPKIVTDIREKLVVIIAEPGMGKSTLITHLALQTKKSQPSLLILKINLIDNAERFKSWRKKKAFSETDIKDFLYSGYSEKTNEGPIKALEKTIFDYCYQEGKMIVMLDGFDEISPDYKTVVIKILKVLQKTTIGGLWITTRPYNIQSDIENVLNTFSYSLEPISKENQIYFLKSYWAQNLKLDEIYDAFIEQLLGWFSEITNDKNDDFVTVPLQLRMIAEVFQNNFEELIKSRKPELPKNYKKCFGEEFNLGILYEMFIDIKFNKILMQEKTGLITAEVTIKKMIEKERTEFFSNHKKLALLSLFGTDGLKLLNIEIGDLVADINKGTEKAGIIDRVIEEKPIFVHKSFAEYFAALWFSDNWKKSIVKSFLMEYIFKEENIGIRRFFDYLLAYENIREEFEEESECDSEYADSDNSNDEAGNKYEFQEMCKPLIENKYALHKAALNNDKIKLKQLLEQQNSYDVVNCIDKGGRTALHLMASYNYYKIFDLFMSEILMFDIDKKDKLFGWSPIIYAEKSGSWNNVESLLQVDANKDELFKDLDINGIYEGPNYPFTDTNMTLLHIATRLGLLNFTKVLIKRGSDVTTPDGLGRSSLHYAASHGGRMIVEVLIQHLKQTNPNKLWEFINIKGEYKFNASHFTAGKGKNEFVLNSGEQIFLGNSLEIIGTETTNGFTALYIAALKGKTDVVEFLLKLVETTFPENLLELINARTTNSFTAIHAAAQEGNTKVVELFLKLVETKFSENLLELINTKTSNGFTALYIAALKGKTDVVELFLKLVESNFPENLVELINTKTTDGCTALHIAAQEGNTKVVELFLKLVETKFPENLLELINTKTTNGFTALFIAALKGKTDVVELFLKLVEFNFPENLLEFINTKTTKGDTALYVAAVTGKTKVVELFLKLVESNFHENLLEFINTKTTDGFTALYAAAQEGKTKVVELFLKVVECNFPENLLELINTKTTAGWTALHIAVQEGKTKVVELFLKLVESNFPENLLELINTKTAEGYTALHIAAVTGKTDVIELFLKLVESNFPENLVELINTKTTDGWTALYIAAQEGKTKVVELFLKLVESNFPENLVELINTKTTDGCTALYMAALTGKTDVIELFLKLVESNFPENLLELINTKTTAGWTALHIAVQEGKTKVVELFLKLVESNFPENLLELINTKTTAGWTALHIAVRHDKTDVIEHLLKLVETRFPENLLEFINTKNTDCWTALHIAVHRGKTEVVELLIKSLEKSKPDKLSELINAKNCNELTTLHVALMNTNPDIIKILIKYNACVVARDNHDTILHQAVSMNNEEILQLILNEIKRTEPFMDPFLNASDTEGDTPLMWAAQHGRLEMGKSLLEYGANLDKQNYDGETALHWAVKGGYYETVKLLLNKNANSNINDKNGKTPIKLAVELWNKDPKNENFNLITKLLSQW